MTGHCGESWLLTSWWDTAHSEEDQNDLKMAGEWDERNHCNDNISILVRTILGAYITVQIVLFSFTWIYTNGYSSGIAVLTEVLSPPRLCIQALSQILNIDWRWWIHFLQKWINLFLFLFLLFFIFGLPTSFLSLFFSYPKYQIFFSLETTSIRK